MCAWQVATGEWCPSWCCSAADQWSRVVCVCHLWSPCADLGIYVRLESGVCPNGWSAVHSTVPSDARLTTATKTSSAVIGEISVLQTNLARTADRCDRIAFARSLDSISSRSTSLCKRSSHVSHRCMSDDACARCRCSTATSRIHLAHQRTARVQQWSEARMRMARLQCETVRCENRLLRICQSVGDGWRGCSGAAH